MNRRNLIEGTFGVGAFALFANSLASAETAAQHSGDLQKLPSHEGKIRVAFMIGQHATVIDFAGPWEVFQDTSLPGSKDWDNAFELFTVAPTEEVVEATAGMLIKPNYSIQNAPQPHVIVVPAHMSTHESREWLVRASAGTDVTMSVCTGAFVVAEAGLLKKGMHATTHHEFFDSFVKKYPDIDLQRGLRFVDNGRIATAGGLTSGIDMALHVVARYFGVDKATEVATYMEHSSQGWRTGHDVSR